MIINPTSVRCTALAIDAKSPHALQRLQTLDETPMGH